MIEYDEATFPNLEEAIAGMHGESGWEKCGGEEDYQALGQRLLAKGFTPQEAFDLLRDAFTAAAGEFGN